MTFNTIEEENEIKNQLITCIRKGKWKSNISPIEKTNPSAGLNYPARIYIHILKDIGVWIISKVVLHHSHSCCLNQAKVLKQHREFNMSVRCTIENSEKAEIRSRKIYQSFVQQQSKGVKLSDLGVFSKLFEYCYLWVLVYLDHHFWLGMRRTQRKKSVHTFFNKFIMHNNSLIQFVRQERESDAADFYVAIPCETNSSIEAQFQHVYTHEKFRKVQAQFKEKVNFITRSTHSALSYTEVEHMTTPISLTYGVHVKNGRHVNWRKFVYRCRQQEEHLNV
ncbi:hypothetical protein Ahy_B09g098006 [Arachis hypogaea]|uniref:Protein FAR1-RELATED SEQUENCE n=1 Tax=Arachis hypogaea TaxID=3818 RepID=A0A444XQC1_ARAHY|nr:hypothetical protein Ahy_B09g098006 [Arachis hypogaea]